MATCFMNKSIDQQMTHCSLEAAGRAQGPAQKSSYQRVIHVHHDGCLVLCPFA